MKHPYSLPGTASDRSPATTMQKPFSDNGMVQIGGIPSDELQALLREYLGKVSSIATANVRFVAFLTHLLRRENSEMSRAILSGFYVVGGPIRDLFRLIRAAWYRGKDNVPGKTPDDWDMSVDPAVFAHLGNDFMEQICDYVVGLIHNEVLVDKTIDASRSGPDSGTYKINVKYGDVSIVIDLSQFKEEEDGQIKLAATIQADAIRRDLTVNALYSLLGDLFARVDHTALEDSVWFELLRSAHDAFLSKKVLDPTGSGIHDLTYDLIDLCGVRGALLAAVQTMEPGDPSQVRDPSHEDTGIVRQCVETRMGRAELQQLEDRALGEIFYDNNFIRALRSLRELKKGATMQPWLVAAMERWVKGFTECTYTEERITRMISLLEMKLPKLLPDARDIPEWATALMGFFVDAGTPGQRAGLLNALIRGNGADEESIMAWMGLFPKLRSPSVPDGAVPFLIEALQRGYSLSQANAGRKKPELKGNVCQQGDSTFVTYKDMFEAQKIDGTLKGPLTDARIFAYVKGVVVERYREAVLEKWLEAGPKHAVFFTGSFDKPGFEVR